MHEAHQWVSPDITEQCGLVLVSCFLRAEILRPVSLLRCSSAGIIRMWRASLSGSSPGCLALFTPVASSHLMEGDRPPLVMLPYTAGVSENIRRVCMNYTMQVIFRSGQSLRLVLSKVKIPMPNQPTQAKLEGRDLL